MRPTRTRNVTRLEAFSDAVFAFSATLLVVSLEVPQSFPQLLADLKGFAAFGISFAALILIWSVHHAFFRRYDLEDRMTVVLNSCLLFVVLFYVYPLKFVSEGMASHFLGVGPQQPRGLRDWDDLATLFLLYGVGFVAVFLMIALLYLHAWRQRERLELDEQERFEASFYSRHYGLFVLVGLISMALAWSGWGLRYGGPGYAYFLIGPCCALHGVLSSRRQRRRDPAP